MGNAIIIVLGCKIIHILLIILLFTEHNGEASPEKKRELGCCSI